MLPLSRLGCPLSLKTPNMGNVGLLALRVVVVLFVHAADVVTVRCALTAVV